MRTLLREFFEFLRKVGTQRRYQVAFCVGITGLVMIIVGNVLEYFHFKPPLVWELLPEVGLACMVAAIAEFFLLEHASEIFRQEVKQEIENLKQANNTFRQEVRAEVENLKQADELFRSEIRQDMQILSHCLEHQLIDILPPGRDEHLAIQQINTALRNARGEIRLLVFTLRDILNSNTLLSMALNRLLDQDEEVVVKLLLIDPKSHAAHTRIMAEKGPNKRFEDDELCDELRANIKRIRDMMNLAKHKSRFRIEARFYSVLPAFCMISTSKEVFIEPCHLGYKPGNGAGRSTVPVLRFSSQSRMYESAQLHFSYIWESLGKAPAPARGNSGQLRANNGLHEDGVIRVRDMDEVIQEIDRRTRRERRSRVLPVAIERRADTDRRHAAA